MFYRILSLRLFPNEKEEKLRALAARLMHVSVSEITGLTVYRKSVDARKGRLSFLYSVNVTVKSGVTVKTGENCRKIDGEYRYIVPRVSSGHPRPVVVGFGPAGLFAALVLAKAGLRPIVLERGAPVEERLQDVDRFFRLGAFLEHSNVSFGEGGAGTFSDGKLNTLLKDKNERGRFILEEFVEAGAPEEILWWNKPHVGTDRLAVVIPNLRRKIESLGGEIRFHSLFLKPLYRNGSICGIRYRTDGREEELPCEALFLAIGHSARDTFAALREAGIPMEKKIFSVGVRIEHLQEKIDIARYGAPAKTLGLPPADYKLAVPVSSGKTLYTFCMCPGGEVVAATGTEKATVTNGMSGFARDGRNANAALLLNVLPSELPEDLFSGFRFQERLEQKAFQRAGGEYRAPCQRWEDFLADRESVGHGEIIPTYSRGVAYGKISSVMPSDFCLALREGVEKMGRQIPGFDHPDAILTAPESRATCPVRLCRGADLQSPISGLYPIGEGAGFAGGIMSSAMDGMKAAESYIKKLSE